MIESPPRSFAVKFRELDKWDYLSNHLRHAFHVKHRIVPIAKIFSIRNRVASNDEIKCGKVRLVDRITFEGEIIAGDRKLTKMTQFVGQPGDILVSKIRARQGSIGLVQSQHGFVSVTNHYRVLIPDSNQIIPNFAHIVLRSEYGRAQFLAATGGTMKGEISEDTLLRINIPLPSLDKQRAIIRRWEQTKAEIKDIQERISVLEEDIEFDFLEALGLHKPKRASLPKVLGMGWKDLNRWSVMYNQLASISVDIATGKYPVKVLGDIANVSYGLQKCPANRPGQHARPYLRVANVQRGELNLKEIKMINVSDADMSSFRLESGDLLVCEGNSADLVGRPAIWRDEIPDCVHQNHNRFLRI